MFEQRLQQRLPVLLVAPALLILLVVTLAVTSAHKPGVQPRETYFDALHRMHPRPVTEATPQIAIIDIDDESLTRVGPWPWPRTAIAGLVAAARDANAASIVVTVPVEGPDPLSPEVVTRFWRSVDGSQDAVRAIAQLPTNDAALAAAAATSRTALSVGENPAAATGWARADAAAARWINLQTDGASDFVAMPAAPVFGAIDPGLSETALIAVSSLPTDPDGLIRRAPVLWSVAQTPAPSAGLAGVVLTDGGPVGVEPATSQLLVSGPPPKFLSLGNQRLPLDRRSGIRLWLPRDLGMTSVPAWRALEGGDTWTAPLAGRIVFIGQSVTHDAAIMTARGAMPQAMVHGQFAQQIGAGAIAHRPDWAGLLEAAAALLLGALSVAATLFAQRRVTSTLCVVFSVVLLGGSFWLFQRTQIMLDPLPALATLVGGPLAVLLTVVGDMLLRDDAVRGQFHGALPRRTMNKLQSGSVLLRGIRRDVTVLSCGLRLPPAVVERFKERPDDFIRYTASANDMLRRTILAHDGTVDYGEDGRLLGYWNVPEALDNPVEKACGCALKMIDDVNTLSENVQSAAFAGEISGNGFDAGTAEGSLEIGLASAACFAGPVGRGSRNRYAVVGDAVKLATALRQRARQYGPAIITDDVVFDALRHHYAFLDLDVVRTDADAPVRTVYGLVGNPFLKASKAFRQLADIQRELVLSWRNQDLPAATRSLQRLRGIPGVPDPYVDLFDARLTQARSGNDQGKATDAADLLSL